MNTKDECIVMDDVVCYSTMSGDLPRMVQEGIPKALVAWTDYVVLQRKYETEVKEILAENVKLKEINGKLSDRLSWKLSDEPCYRVK